MTTMRRILALSGAILFACDIQDIEHGIVDDAEQTFPTRMAEEYCATLFACENLDACGDAVPYASEEECVQGERTALEQMRTAARDAGMTFDATCVDRWIAQFDELGCEGERRAKHLFGEFYDAVGCQPYYGTVPEGEDPCVEIVGTELSNCGQNLYCYDERECYPIGEPAECECAEGTRCDYVEGYPGCLPLVGIGDVCGLPDGTRTAVCPQDAYCPLVIEDGMVVESACIAAAPLGAACVGDHECASGTCEQDVCVAPIPWVCAEPFAPRHFR